jgi:hypothetical protein
MAPNKDKIALIRFVKNGQWRVYKGNKLASRFKERGCRELLGMQSMATDSV